MNRSLRSRLSIRRTSTQIIIRRSISLAILEAKLVNTSSFIFTEGLYTLLRPRRKFLNLSSNKSTTQTTAELYALSYTTSIRVLTLLGYSTRSLLLISPNLAIDSVAKWISLQIIYQIASTINTRLAITSRLPLLLPE